MNSLKDNQPPRRPRQRLIRRIERLVKLLCGLAIVIMTTHCTQWPTRCSQESDCPKRFFCAQTDKPNFKICALPQVAAIPHPQAQRAMSPIQFPKRTLPTSSPLLSLPFKPCVAPPYNPADDPGNGGKKIAMDELDRGLFRMLRRVYYASKHCHTNIWGGSFELHRIPTYLVNTGYSEPGSKRGIRGFLLHHPSPPANAILVDSRQTGGLYDVYLYNGHKGRIAPPGFDFSLSINKLKTYAMAYGHARGHHPNSIEFTRLFVHEAFHRTQAFEEEWESTSGNQETQHYPFRAEDIASLLLEQRILLDGYESLQRKKALLALQMFYVLRTLRIRSDPSPNRTIENYENFQEHLEGTAMYVENRYMIAIGKPFQPKELNSIEDRLFSLETHARQADATFLREAIFARFYGTGAALAVLLDRIGDTEWKESCRRGTTLYQHLRKRFSSLSVPRHHALLRQIKKQFDSPALQNLAQQYAAKIKATPP